MDSDPSPDITHSLDQFGAMLGSMAPVLAQYYRALIAAGLSHEMARDLVRDYHQAWVYRITGSH